MARAAFASGGVEVVSRALTIVVSIGTARVLEPREVGLLGLAVIIVGVLSLAGGCAETAAVISRSRGSKAGYAWSAVVIRGSVTLCLLSLLRFAFPVVGELLGGRDSASGELTVLVNLLCWQLIIEVIGAYPRVLLQRDLRLTCLSAASLLRIVAHVGLSLAFLLGGYGAIGLVWGSLLADGAGTAFLWSRLQGSRVAAPDVTGGRGLWRQVILATAKVFSASVVGYLNGRFGNLVVASVLGAALMSFYGMAWSMSRIPIWILTQALSPVLLPTLAQVRGEAFRVERIVRESLRYSCLIFVPACALLFFAGQSLVTTVLGAKWQPLVPALQIMSLTVLMGPLVIVANGLLIATERAHLTSFATGSQFVAQVLMMVPMASRWGIVGAAVADLASTVMLTAALVALCRLTMPETKLKAWSSALMPVSAAATAGILTRSLCSELPEGLIRLVCEAAGFLLAYVAVLWLLGGKGRLTELLGLIGDVAGRPAALAASSDVTRRGD